MRCADSIGKVESISEQEWYGVDLLYVRRTKGKCIVSQGIFRKRFHLWRRSVNSYYAPRTRSGSMSIEPYGELKERGSANYTMRFGGLY
jgi:hypothetical protein